MSFWLLRYAEARTHAMVMATLIWIGAAVLILARPGYLDLAGHLKGADFVHFYTLGRLAVDRRSDALYDLSAQHEAQTRLVPASASDTFVPVYPPQTALLFAPFAMLPYPLAAVFWAVTTAAVYAWAVRAAWKSARDVLTDGMFVTAAALAFPPFWNLVLHGQTTAIPLAAFVLGWLALERGRRFLAGLALGLVAVKPQFGLVLAVVLLAAGEGTVLAGAAVSVVAQMLAAAALLGPEVVRGYIAIILRLPDLAPLLEPKPYQLHSIRAVTGLLPAPIGTIVWTALSAMVVGQTVRVWRLRVPLPPRFGVLAMATVLVSPHLTVYDATLLAPAFLWIGAWLMRDARLRVTDGPIFWSAVYWLFPVFLLPTALFIKVQVSVLILGWLFFRMSRRVIETAPVRVPTSRRASADL